MKTKFTPGPWNAEKFDVFCQNGGFIASCNDGYPEEDHANAALIADAPAMYELLRRISEENSCWIDNDLLDQVDDLLAKHEDKP